MTNYMYRRLGSFLIFLWLMALLGLIANPVEASIRMQTTCEEYLNWKNQRLGSFVLVYTSSDQSIVNDFVDGYGTIIEEDLQDYSVLFGIEIEIPITIRIYPTRSVYECLNPLGPLVAEADSHSHIGRREIAIIGDAITISQGDKASLVINGMRHELAVLFGEVLTNGNAPPGLLQGMGGYFESPIETFDQRFNASGNIQMPTRSIQRLLEEDVPASNDLILLQQTSIAAFLIDVYGWANFSSFLEMVGELGGYRQALTEVYDLSIQEIQTDWESYFPLYVTERWRYNLIHSFDLDRYDILIAAGAYQDALTGLETALPIVSLFADEDTISRAQRQLSTAQQGVLAGTLTVEARQALLEGDYSTSIEKSEEAIAVYAQLNDTRRTTELETYRDMAFEILTLRTELENLKGFDTPLDPQKTQRILQIGKRLSELGDAEGVREVQVTMILLSTGQRYFVEWTTVIGLLICVVLVYRRIRDLFRLKPPEVDLL